MVVNDTHRIVVIHIPKCAGSLVREKLLPFDEADGAFWLVRNHVDLGQIDYAHIPLFILRTHFPAVYQKVLVYDTYAIVRDPWARFPSSFSQYLNASGRGPIHTLKQSAIRHELENVIKVLKEYSDEYSFLPYEYIHFQRQRDFIEDEGQRLVDRVYDLDHIHSLFADLYPRLGLSTLPRQCADLEKRNAATVYRNAPMRIFFEAAKPILRPLIPNNMGVRLRNALKRAAYLPLDKGMKDIFESQHILDFIGDYYRSDILLHQKVDESDGLLTRD